VGTAAPILLDTQQSLAVRLVLARTNVALVGPAGCGKSVVLRALVDAGRRRFGHDSVLVLAWAGSATQLVGGLTVSSVLRTTVGDRSKRNDPVAEFWEPHGARRATGRADGCD